jgi:hypothetical protein
VKKQPFFSQFQMPMVLELCRHLHTRRVKAGEWLFRQGEDAGRQGNALFCLLGGAAAVFQRFEEEVSDGGCASGGSPKGTRSQRPASPGSDASPHFSRSDTRNSIFFDSNRLSVERSLSSQGSLVTFSSSPFHLSIVRRDRDSALLTYLTLSPSLRPVIFPPPHSAGPFRKLGARSSEGTAQPVHLTRCSSLSLHQLHGLSLPPLAVSALTPSHYSSCACTCGNCLARIDAPT